MSTKPIIIIVVLAAVIVAGYFLARSSSTSEENGNGGEPAVNGNGGEAVEFTVKAGENFLIELKSNPSTGYQWQTEYDETYLLLVEHFYVPDTLPEGGEGVVGAGGVEKFDFRGLVPGATQITFSYAREWEEEPIETKVYEITIEEAVEGETGE